MKFLYNEKYRKIVVKQLKEQLIFFLQESIEFNIIVNITQGVTFYPPLPNHIFNAFNDYTIFALAGYTFQSAYIENDTLVFEAGFGKENIGAIVKVDIDRILQITKNETPIFINLIATIDKMQIKDSLQIFKSKEKNKKFFKKRG